MGNTDRIMPLHIIAAAGIVINEKNEILMIKNNRRGWEFPGGQVEVGENVIDAVKRDGFIFSLLVAGGIQVNVHKLIGLYLEPELVWTGGKPTKAEENYYPWYVNGLLPGPDNTKLQTYRTEHPFMFSVSTGLRINLGK